MATASNSPAQTVIQRFSVPRMARYLRSAEGDADAALNLYGEQARAAAVLWQTIGHVEVVMPNAMHDALSLHSERWYDSLDIVFNDQTRGDIAQARERLRKANQTETPGHLVAELNFGFWRFLLARNYDRTLWTPYLNKAFPHYSGRRDVLFNLTRRINDVRNTVAHHQRLENPKAAKRDALELVGFICPDTESWIKTECKLIEAVLASPV